MSEKRAYTLLKKVKYKLTKQQYLTIKGQIKKGDLQGAFVGIMKVMGYKV